jgi:hypothetical protein
MPVYPLGEIPWESHRRRLARTVGSRRVSGCHSGPLNVRTTLVKTGKGHPGPSDMVSRMGTVRERKKLATIQHAYAEGCSASALMVAIVIFWRSPSVDIIADEALRFGP